MSDTVLAVAKTAGGWLVISLHNLQGYLRSPQITEGSWVLDLMVTGSHLQESSKSLKQRVQDIIGSISGSHAVPLPSQPIVQEQVRETVKTMGRRLEKGMDILTRGSWEVILTPQPLFQLLPLPHPTYLPGSCRFVALGPAATVSPPRSVPAPCGGNEEKGHQCPGPPRTWLGPCLPATVPPLPNLDTPYVIMRSASSATRVFFF